MWHSMFLYDFRSNFIKFFSISTSVRFGFFFGTKENDGQWWQALVLSCCVGRFRPILSKDDWRRPQRNETVWLPPNHWNRSCFCCDLQSSYILGCFTYSKAAMAEATEALSVVPVVAILMTLSILKSGYADIVRALHCQTLRAALSCAALLSTCRSKKAL